MTRFLHWRKMTWAIVAWTALSAAWVVSSVGMQLGDLSAGIPAVWVAGTAVLSVVWFGSRPLWRQGHGFRLRRLQRPLAP
jgi:hypothetical protein